MSAMLGVLITLLFSVGAACFGHLLIRRLTENLDSALAAGLAGLTGLGAIGTLTLFIGLVPGGLSNTGIGILAILVAASTAGCLKRAKIRNPISVPRGPQALFVVAIGLALFFALVSVLAPSDTVEWDSLAYHLAVPKIWLHAGHIEPISYIHHSNFPFAVDNLYIWGLAWGGESGAKAFTLAFQVFGILSVFGLARQIYGTLAGWWAALAWATVPAVLWLSGTAYIDVQNGLYAGLGILFAALYVKDRIAPYPWLAGIMLGLATGSKYTGLQTIFAVGVVMLGALVLGRKATDEGNPLKIKAIAIACGLAFLIASPWFIKNVLWMGNPVYPFFSSKLGGKYWSDWQAKIYSNEQQTFGAARPFAPDAYTAGPIQPQRIGQAILGLAYQPGRYINPGQTSGLGFPMGAIGFAMVATMILWMISGRASPFESSLLVVILISLAMWFVLSEQSRYIIALCVPLAVLAGGGVSKLRAGPVLAGGLVLQSLVSFYVIKAGRFDQQIQVVAGKVSEDNYLESTVEFYEPAKYLNQTGSGGRVALYDEVFGYFLDMPYLWANPGHSNELGYERMQTADDLIASLKREGVTTVYLNLAHPDEQIRRWTQTFGIARAAQPYGATERAHLMEDLNWRSKILLGEAIASHKLEITKVFDKPTRLILAVR
jgi:hypothetical protein